MTRYTPLWEQQGSYAASVDRRLIAATFPTAYVIGCAVSVSSGMTVNVAPGSVVVPSSNSTGSLLCASDATEQVTLAAAPASGTNRYDLIICQARGNDLDGGANNDFLFTTVTGTAAASPAVPAVPNNATMLAQIYVPGGSASVTAGNITDTRWTTVPGQVVRTAASGGAGNASTAAEAVISICTTPPLYIPTATKLVTVTFSFRQSSGTGGEAAIVRIREGTTVAGLELMSVVSILANAGLQVGTGPGGTVRRTYAPGAGVKQWSATLQSVSANQVTLSNATAYPLTTEVIDAGG